MARSVGDFIDLMVSLLPPGDAWAIENNADLLALFTAAAQEFARVDAAIDAMFTESLPSEAEAWLPEWEADFGLPDSDHPLPDTVLERQRLVTARVTAIAGDDRQRLLDVAATLGFDITLTEFMPGDVIPGHTNIDPDDSVFYVLVSGLPLTYLSTFKAGDVAGLPLRTWRHETLLEHELSRILHSHKQFIFTYGS